MKSRMKILILAISCIICILIATHFKVIRASGTSMLPTLAPGQAVLCRKSSDYQLGDIVLIQKGNLWVLKRISALPESHMDVADHYWGSSNIPIGYYFVTGDNPNNSFDSRDPDFGLVSEDDIWGHAIWY